MPTVLSERVHHLKGEENSPDELTRQMLGCQADPIPMYERREYTARGECLQVAIG
jgi:hypothetical protein